MTDRRAFASACLSALALLMVTVPAVVGAASRPTVTGSWSELDELPDLGPSPAEVALTTVAALAPLLVVLVPAIVLALLSPAWSVPEKVAVVAVPWLGLAGATLCLQVVHTDPAIADRHVFEAVLLAIWTIALLGLLVLLARRAHRRARAA